MAITKKQIKKYFHEMLIVDVSPEVWQPSRRFPLFLRDGYTYYEIEVLGIKCLLMADLDDDRSAASIQKHIEQVRVKWSGEIIYARDQVTSLDRKRLIGRKIPFVVPGNQMYLPMLGIDLREHFRRLRDEVTTFSPATQAAILLMLTTPERHTYNAMQLANQLKCSKMTASRCLNELNTEKLNVIHLRGRTRLLEFDGDRRALWERALPALSSPVKHRHYVLCNPGMKTERISGVDAGLTALSKYSMLAAPRMPGIAVTTKQWKTIKTQPNITPTNATDPNANEIEVWSYDPLLFAEEGTCDPYSLFLSLRDDKDERVESALEEMMEAVP